MTAYVNGLIAQNKDLQQTVDRLTVAMEVILKAASFDNYLASTWVAGVIREAAKPPLKLEGIHQQKESKARLALDFNRHVTDEELEKLTEYLRMDGAPWL